MDRLNVSRRSFCMTAGAALLSAAWAASVRAAEEWCTFDPAMVLTTPHGNEVVVYVAQSGQGLQHLGDLQAATLSYSSTGRNLSGRHDDTATQFHIFVTVPSDPIDGTFATMVQVSSGPNASGTIYATAQGPSGTTLDAVFTVPLP